MNDVTHSAGSGANGDTTTDKAAADKTIVERAQEAAGSAADKVSSAAGTAASATGSAARAAVDAIKEHPVAAAAIGAGVAAAAAGVAYGVSKLGDDDKAKGSAKSGGAKSSPAKH